MSNNNIEWIEELSPEELGKLICIEVCTIPLNVDYIKTLIQSGANLNLVNVYGIPPIHYLITDNNLDLVKYFVFSGADLDARDESGSTALHYATRSSTVEMVQLLLDLGASKEALDNKGRTPWIVASLTVLENVPEIKPNV